MALKWSKRDGGHYDCIESVTPVGTIRIEWKGWKDDDSPDGEMPWGESFWGSDLEEAKARAQQLWDARMVELEKFNKS